MFNLVSYNDYHGFLIIIVHGVRFVSNANFYSVDLFATKLI